MKYLKLFEDYYYDSKKFNPNQKLISIDKGLIDDISQIGFNPSIEDYPADYSINYIYIKTDTSIICIFQYTDEWYEVQIDTESGVEYYWCDQKDGLIKFLEDYKGGKLNESKTFHQMSDDEVNHVYPDPEEGKGEYYNGPEDFIQSEFEYLKSKYNNVSYGRVKSMISINNSAKLHLSGKKIGNFFVDIEKLKDEWYIVYYGYVTKGKVYNGSEVVSELVWKYKWYKCDQWNGLVDCLESLISKNINESYYQKMDNGWISNLKTDYIPSMVSFDKKELEYIKDKIQPFVYKIRIDDRPGDILGFNGYIDIFLKMKEGERWEGCSVFKLIDDWYILTQNHASWKCDQLDGLIECIKQKMINI